MIISLINKDARGNKNALDLSFIIIPANNAIATIGEKPDHSNLGAKNNFDRVLTKTKRTVNNNSL